MIINFVTGILTGIIVSIPPMGPIAFAMISRGFNNEIKEAKSIALGAALIDFFYCLIAFGGIALMISFLPGSASDFYSDNSYLIGITLTFAGCIIVVLYGIKIMRSKITFSKLEASESGKYNSALEKANKLSEKAKLIAKRIKVSEVKKANLIGLFFMGVLLCMSSLTLPASWIALVGYLKGFDFLNSSFLGGLLFSAGAFIGTFTWFYILLKLISKNKEKFNHGIISKLNIIAGVILLLLGVFLFIKAIISVFSIL